MIFFFFYLFNHLSEFPLLALEHIIKVVYLLFKDGVLLLQVLQSTQSTVTFNSS